MRFIQIVLIPQTEYSYILEHALTDEGKIMERFLLPDGWSVWEDMTCAPVEDSHG